MDSTQGPAMGKSWPRRILIAAVIVLIIVVVFYSARKLIMGSDHFTIERTKPIVSHVDGMAYRVHEAHSGPDKAADTLAIINSRVIAILRHLRSRYLRGTAGDMYPERRAAVIKLLARYNPDNLAENSPKDPSGDTAYSLDKGAIVAICLREKGAAAPPGHSIHDLDTLMFVTLHEMSHIAIDEIDHPPPFWSTFKFLLEEAEESGIYVSPDFSRSPARYCGVNVDYNPRYDPNTHAI